MKTITLWQPWASLLACGAKQYETRSWATSYRGPIAIHAATKAVLPWFQHEVEKDVRLSIIKTLADSRQGLLQHLPRGAVIATAELVGCHEMVRHGGRGLSSVGPGWLETNEGVYEPSDDELLFGDWTPGRYAWEFANMRMLGEPIPAKGGQRLWNWEPHSAQKGADQ